MWTNKMTGWMIAGVMLFSVALADAATYTWGVSSGGNWSVTGNWTTSDGSTFPGSGDTAIIGDNGAAQTILYDSSASSSLGTLTFNASSYTNTVKIIRSGAAINMPTNALYSVTTPTLTIANNVTLESGSYLYLDPSQNQNTAIGSNIALTVGTITVNTGATLELGQYYYYTTASANNGRVSILNGNVSLAGGTLIDSLTTAAASGVTGSAATYSTTITGALSMTAGTIKVDSTSSARLTIGGNFTMSGGSIVNSAGTTSTGGLINLLGTTNVITGSTGSVTGVYFYLYGTNQSFASSIYIPAVMARALASDTKTISSSYNTSGSDNQIGTLTISQATAGSTTGFKLASDLRVGSFSFANGATGTVGSLLDLNDHKMTLTSASTWVPNSQSGTNLVNWYITNTGSSNGEISAAAFNFSSAQQVNVGYAAPTTASSSSTQGTASTGIVVLHATGASGTNDLGGGGLINPTARFWYTGNNASSGSSTLTVTGNRTVGKVEVGDGSVKSVLKLVTTSLTVAGDVKVNSASVFDLNGQVLNLSGTASLSGNGTIQSSTSGSSIAFLTGATGGFSPGGTANSDGSSIGNVGTLTITAANISGITLASTSVSTFDFYSASSYDKVNLGGVSLTLNGQVALNFINGYLPTLGTTFDILTNDTGVTGSFSSITSNLSGLGYTFTVDSTGLVTVTAIPEPSAFVLMVMGMALFLRKSLRRSYSF